MSGIADLAFSQLGVISSEYVKNIQEPAAVLDAFDSRVRGAGDVIFEFGGVEPDFGRSLIAVDGGNALEQLSGGDLIVAGATAGESVAFARRWDDDSLIPSEVFTTILPHSSYNDKLMKIVRAVQELRVLAGVGNSGYRIIDGAYLGNVSAFVYGLIDSNVDLQNGVLSYSDFDSDGLLGVALNELLVTDLAVVNDVVAIPKSDSSSLFVKQYSSRFKVELPGLSDRLLAARILKPGEFVMPRNLVGVPGLVSGVEKFLGSDSFGKGSVDVKRLRGALVDMPGFLRRVGNGPTEEGFLWTTYFKPSNWGEYAGVIKIEFFHSVHVNGSVVDRAKELIGIVDSDIVTEMMLEPYAQYEADRRAKEVSVAMNIIKSQLLGQIGSEREAAGMLRNYRT